MGKLLSLGFALELCLILKFASGDIFEDYDDFSRNKNLGKRSTDVKTNGSQTMVNVSLSTTTLSTGNMSLTTLDSKNKQQNNGTKTGGFNTTTSNLNNTQHLGLENNQTKLINNIINNITTKYPEASKNINFTLQNLGINDPTMLLVKLNQSNLTLNEIKSSINQTNLQKEINKSQAIADSDIAKAVFRQRAETALKDINNSMANTSLSGWTNRTTNMLRTNWNFTRGLPTINMTMLLDPDYNPNLWLKRLQAPWKHVSGSNTANETEVVQVCKFDTKVATCSAQYNAWGVKAWFQFAEAPGRNGINITVYEHGHIARVSFYNKVNGTDCQIFNNGSLHQICVKVYGYDKDLGPTRVCLQLGAAIFNNGVASSDFGCFRFGSAVRHEHPMEGESPHARLLNRYILNNNYTNIKNSTGNGSLSIKANIIWLLIAIAVALLSSK